MNVLFMGVHRGQNTKQCTLKMNLSRQGLKKLRVILKVIIPCYLSRTDVENIITDVENKHFEPYRCGEYYHRCGECVFFLIACMGKRNH